MSRVRDHVEVVTLHPVTPSALTTAECAAFLASLRAAECAARHGTAHSTADAWRRTLCVGCCPAHPPRCRVSP